VIFDIFDYNKRIFILFGFGFDFNNVLDNLQNISVKTLEHSKSIGMNLIAIADGIG
jgi:hypothetical protein